MVSCLRKSKIPNGKLSKAIHGEFSKEIHSNLEIHRICTSRSSMFRRSTTMISLLKRSATMTSPIIHECQTSNNIFFWTIQLRRKSVHNKKLKRRHKTWLGISELHSIICINTVKFSVIKSSITMRWQIKWIDRNPNQNILKEVSQTHKVGESSYTRYRIKVTFYTFYIYIFWLN